MPNWCSNKLTISHIDENEVNVFVEKYREGVVIDHYLPMPRKPDGNITDNWFDWCCANWGTKWDIGSEDNERRGLHPTVVGNEASMTFHSAYHPPIGLYERLTVLGFNVRALYWEPGHLFGGIWEDNNEEHIKYGHYKELPKEIIEVFNIEELYEEWEEAQ